jgi:hypothetical protein
MPLPMVHLTVAVRRYESDGTLPPAFLLGSLAPDAIHMRPGAGREDKARTHLLAPPDTADHAAIRDLLGRYRTADRELADFAAGYAAHLLTDRHWAEAVYRPFRRALPPTLDPVSRRELYYRETDQLDFDLYHHMPWRPRVWELLALAPARDFAGLLKAAEIGRSSDRFRSPRPTAAMRSATSRAESGPRSSPIPPPAACAARGPSSSTTGC